MMRSTIPECSTSAGHPSAQGSKGPGHPSVQAMPPHPEFAWAGLESGRARARVTRDGTTGHTAIVSGVAHRHAGDTPERWAIAVANDALGYAAHPLLEERPGVAGRGNSVLRAPGVGRVRGSAGVRRIHITRCVGGNISVGASTVVEDDIGYTAAERDEHDGKREREPHRDSDPPKTSIPVLYDATGTSHMPRAGVGPGDGAVAMNHAPTPSAMAAPAPRPKPSGPSTLAASYAPRSDSGQC